MLLDTGRAHIGYRRILPPIASLIDDLANVLAYTHAEQNIYRSNLHDVSLMPF